MSKQTKHKFNIIVILASLVSLAFIGLLFTPYFRIFNTITHELRPNEGISGITCAIGGQNNFIGSNILYIGEIIGAVGGLLTLIFAIWYILSKKQSPFMYFFLGMSIPCVACQIAVNFLSGPLFLNNNGVKAGSFYAIMYTPTFFISTGLTITAFLLNCFILFYISFATHKK